MSGKSQTIRDFTVCRPPRFCRLMKTRNLRYPRSSGMNGDPDASQISAMVGDHSRHLYRPGHRHPSAMDFPHYQSPKLLGSSLWGPVLVKIILIIFTEIELIQLFVQLILWCLLNDYFYSPNYFYVFYIFFFHFF